jgi:hypothetical protein
LSEFLPKRVNFLQKSKIIVQFHSITAHFFAEFQFSCLHSKLPEPSRIFFVSTETLFETSYSFGTSKVSVPKNPGINTRIFGKTIYYFEKQKKNVENRNFGLKTQSFGLGTRSFGMKTRSFELKTKSSGLKKVSG